jgi:4-amino-4-deoxy-L-arabinose transferase-like glycosyltransferase
MAAVASLAPETTARERRWLALVLLLAAALRLGWVIYATRDPVDAYVSGDPGAYYHYGQEIARGNGYVSFVTGEPTAFFPIGYPAFLAAIFFVVQHTPVPDNLPLAATVVHAILGTATVGLVFAIVARLFDARTGLLAAAITALFPNLVHHTATLHLETTFIFLALAAVAVAVGHDWSSGPPGPGRLLAFGTVLGLSALVRPFSLLFLVGLVAAVALAGGGWRRGLAGAGVALVPVVLLAAPWTIRNLVRMDAVVTYSTNMGDTVCLDRSYDATGRFSFAPHCFSGYEGVPPEEIEQRRNSENTRRALRFIREHPGREIVQIGKRAVYMVEDDHDGLTSLENGGRDPFLPSWLRTTLTWIADWYFYVVGAVGLVGLPLLLNRRPDRLFVGLALLSLVAVPLGLYGYNRFHVPWLPFLAGTAAAATTRVLAGRRAARAPTSSAASS